MSFFAHAHWSPRVKRIQHTTPPPPDSALARGDQLKSHYVDHKSKEITFIEDLSNRCPPSEFKFPLLLYNLLAKSESLILLISRSLRLKNIARAIFCNIYRNELFWQFATTLSSQWVEKNRLMITDKTKKQWPNKFSRLRLIFLVKYIKWSRSWF